MAYTITSYSGPNPTYQIMVTSSSDLTNLPADITVGSIAYTAGYTSVWQKAQDGSWVSLV